MYDPIRIFLVDDSPHFLRATEDFLGGHPGLQVVDSATDAEEAVRKSHGLQPDVILLDLNLGERSGLDLIPRFREHLPLAKIIVLTILEPSAYQAVALQAGADAFVHKAGMLKELLPVIHQSLQQVPTRPAPVDSAPASNRSREQFGRLVEHSADFFYRYEFEPRRGYTYVNAAVTAVTGYSRQEFYTDADLGLKLIHPDDRAVFDAVSEGSIVLRWVRKDGRVIWVEQQIVSVLNEFGEQTAVEGLVRDITERKIAEQALAQSEDRYRDLVENSQDLICTHDLEGRILSANPASTRLLGYGLEELIGSNIRDHLAPETRSRFGEYLERLKCNGTAAGFLIVLTRTGERRVWEYQNTLRTEGVAQPVVRGMARDVTERRQAEAALRDSRAQLEGIFNTAMDAIITIDEEQRIVIFNPAAEQVFGCPAGEVVGRPLERFLPEHVREGHRQYLRAFSESNSTKRSMKAPSLALTCLRADGAAFPSEVSISQLEIGGKKYFTAIVRDITERKMAEEALEKSESDYRRLFDNANDVILIFEPAQETVLEANAAACAVYGFERSELLGMSLRNLTKDVGRGEAQIRAMLESGSYRDFESVHFNKKGEEIFFLINSSVIDYGGRKAILSINRNITERKRTEDEIRRLKEFDETLINHMAEGIAVQNPGGFFTYVNPAVTAITGFPPEELIGEHWTKFIPADQHAVIREADEMRPSGRASRYETVFLHKNGRRIHLLVSGSPFFANGCFEGTMAVFTDITDRKQAEETLQEKERLLSESQHMAHIGSWNFDIASGTLQFSDEMYRLLGVSREKFRHDAGTFLGLVYSPDRPAAAKWFQEIADGRQVKELVFRVFHMNDELRYLQCAGAVVFDGRGRPARFIGTAQDITERTLAEMQIRQQIEQLTALRKIDQAITSSFNLRPTLETILSQVIVQLHVDAADVLLLDPGGRRLEYAAGRGFRTKAVEAAKVRVGEGYAGRAAQERRSIRIDRLKDQPDDPPRAALLADEDFASYFGVPLIAKGTIKGVLEIYQRVPFEPYPEWVDFLNILAGQAAIAVENASLFENLQSSARELERAYDMTIEGWSRALDLRDKETEGHTLRVTEMAARLAAAFGFDEQELTRIRWGALLHDIGKMGVPDGILLKEGELTEAEWEVMQKHPTFAYELLSPIRHLGSAIDIPYCHHEKWDGTGYPRGLRGEKIPLPARIFAIVDAYDALTSDRPYRPAWSRQKTLAHIRALSGTHFDPQVVRSFVDMLARD